MNPRSTEARGTAVAESLFATRETELLERQPSPMRDGLRTATEELIAGFSNHGRRHTHLGHVSRRRSR